MYKTHKIFYIHSIPYYSCLVIHPLHESIVSSLSELTVAALGVDDPLVLPELVVGDVVEGVLGVRRPEHRRVVLEVALDYALRGGANLRGGREQDL